MADIPAGGAAALRLGLACIEAQRWRPACRALEQASADPDPALRCDALLAWADALVQLGNVEEAARRLDQALAAAPGQTLAYARLADLLPELEAPETAAARAARHAEAAGTRDALAALAGFEIRRGRSAQARALYERAAGVGTLTAPMRLGWAWACGDSGAGSEALAQMRQAWSAPGADVLHEEAVGTVLDHLWRGALPDAARMAELGQAAEASGHPAVLGAWAATLQHLGQWQEAARFHEAALRADPARAAAPGGLATCRLVLGDVEAAAEALAAAPGDGAIPGLVHGLEGGEALVQAIDRRVATGDVPARLAWADQLQGLGRPAQAVSMLESVRVADPAAVPGARWAHALHAAGQAPQALQAAMQAVAASATIDDGLAELLRDLLNAADPALQAQAQLLAEALPGAPAIGTWAQALDRAGQPDAAAAANDRALALDPAHAAVRRQAALLQCRRRRPDVGVAWLAEAVAAGADQPLSPDERRDLLAAWPAAPAAATEALVQALKAAPLHDARRAAARGQDLLALHQPEAAVAVLRPARATWPDAAEPLSALAEAWSAAGHPAAAVEACVAAVDLGIAPDQLPPLLATFRAAALRLDGDEAIAEMDAAIVRQDGAHALRHWALVLGALDRPGGELRHYEAAADRRPGDATVRAEWAYRLQLAGQADRAAAEHARAAARAPAEPFVAYIRGRALSDAQRYEEALAHYALQARLSASAGAFDALSAVVPERFESTYGFDLGVALDGAGRREDAVRAYRQGTDRPESPVNAAYCLHNIAYIRQSQGDYRAARGAWRDALEAYAAAVAEAEGEPDFFNYHAVAFQFAQNDLALAQRLHEEALRLNPRSTLALTGIVRLLMRRAEEAGSAPDDRDRVARLQAQARETAAWARTLLERRLKDLDRAATRHEAGQLALLRSDVAAALVHLQAATRLEPERSEIWLSLAQAQWRQGDAAAALDACRRAVAIDPDGLDTRTALGEAYRRKDDPERAEAEFRRVLAMAPGHVDARLGLGRTLVGRAEAARREARPADAEPLCAQALDQLAQADMLEGGPDGSRALSSTERDNLSYLRGYVKIMRYELQAEPRRDAALLNSALADFQRVPPRAANHHRAQRALQRIHERTRPVLSPASWGAGIVVAGAVATLLLANIAFLAGRPALLPTAALKPEVLAPLRAASVPAEALGRVQALVAQGVLPKAEMEKKLAAALGEATVKAQAADLALHTVNGQRRGWGEGIDAGYYALLSFGSLLFVVAGLYLRQLSKLKIGGIELEKSADPGLALTGSLDIGAPDWQPSAAAPIAAL